VSRVLRLENQMLVANARRRGAGSVTERMAVGMGTSENAPGRAWSAAVHGQTL